MQFSAHPLDHMNDSFETGDLIDIFQGAVDSLNFYWNFYVVALIAVLGWLISLKRDLTGREKGILTVGYVGFVGMNVLALANTYRVLEAARLDLVMVVPETMHLAGLLGSVSFARQRWVGWLVHLVVDVAVIVAIWRIRVPRPGRMDEQRGAP